jgi:type VI secretion system protein ImpJ
MSRRLYKLIWSEGMYLAPQHFQAQSRFFEDSVRFITDCFSEYHYGFLHLRIDEEALRRGTFQPGDLDGVMPDGLVFQATERGEVPAREIAEHYPNTGRPLMLYLAVPAYREGRQNVAAAENGSSYRYRKLSVERPDFNTGQDAKKVDLLEPSLRVALEGELRDDDVALPIARILQDGKGEFVLDPTWAPPCLQVSASSRLEARLERLIEILHEKSRSLSARRLNAALSDVRGDPRELAEFWLLHSVNSAIPVLRLRKEGKSPHPAELYRALSQLAGSLCTFAPNSEPVTLPEYDHEALGDCFAALDDHIRRHLELGLPTNCIEIPLERFQTLFHGGTVGDPRCFGPSRWVLGIRSTLPETSIIANVPGMVKVSARDWIERVVRQAVPGVPLTYMPSPPAAIRPQLETVYFSLDQNHRLFDPIRNNRNVGIYVPRDLANPELDLHVVLGGS